MRRQQNSGMRWPVWSSSPLEIDDDRVTAVVPQPDFAPCFAQRAMDEGLLEANSNGATWMTP